MKKNVMNKAMIAVKWCLPFYLFAFMPLSMLAQDDDLYFVSKKNKSTKVEEVQDPYGMPKDTYYSGSNRDVDEYNRRWKSQVEEITDSVDSLKEDYALTKKMTRFEDYQLADNAAFWAGYRAGRDDWRWGWHSPWYYTTWGWYDPWYDPWYYGYAGWYDPWYYRGYWGWRYPYYRPVVVVGGGGRRYSTIGTGNIRRNGSTYGHRGGFYGYRGTASSSLRQRAEAMSGGRRYSSGNRIRSGSGNFSGYRGSGGYNGGGSFSGSRSSGSFSGGSRGGGGRR